MTVSREDQDADKQPVWTSPNDRLVQRYRYNRDHGGKGPFAMIAFAIGSLLALVGLSSK